MNSIQTMPAKAVGKGADNDERIEPGLEIHDDQQIDQHDRQREADEQLIVGAPSSSSVCPRSTTVAPARRVFPGILHDLLDVVGDRAEIALIVGGENVDDRLDGVMGNDGVAEAALDRRDAAEDLRG